MSVHASYHRTSPKLWPHPSTVGPQVSCSSVSWPLPDPGCIPEADTSELLYISNVLNHNTVVWLSCRSTEKIRVYAENVGQDWRDNLGVKFFWNLGVLAVALVVFVLRKNSHDEKPEFPSSSLHRPHVSLKCQQWTLHGRILTVY